MNKPKILLLITRLNNGGAAKHAALLASLLNSDRFDTLLVTGRTENDEDDLSGFAVEHNVTPVVVTHLKRNVRPLHDLLAFFSLYAIIRRQRPDIIHTHMSKAGFVGRAAAIVYNLCHKKKIKIVHTFHGHVFHSYFSRKKTALYIFLEGLLAKKSDRLVAVSPAVRDQVDEKIRVEEKAKFKIIPLGLDFKPLKKDSGQGNQSGIINIGMLGRLAPIKNYGLAVKIAKLLFEKQIPARIVVGGGGSDSDFKNLTGQDVKTISFLGNIEEPAHFWHDIHIALVTSKNEGTPVSLIEAMCSGVPFIAPFVGGIPDMAREPQKRQGNLSIYSNCILVHGFEPEDFLAAISHYLDRQTREDAGQAAARFAYKHHSMATMLESFERLYSTIS